MLDDLNVLNQRDPAGALDVAKNQFEQVKFTAQIQNPDNDGRHIQNIVVAGMGGSALAALLVQSWLKSDLKLPVDVVRSYDLPEYVGENTLVIASSYSGNTEETVSVFEQARQRGAQLAVIASGGKLLAVAEEDSIVRVVLPADFQPRMAVILNLRALVSILKHFGVTPEERFSEIASTADWLQAETANWAEDVETGKNYAKQLALLSVGKTPVVYSGSLMAPVAYKWKISWNENAKNLAFWNQYPEFSHNEFIGWSSHPIEKPFIIFDLVSGLENSQILKRIDISDRLLSGQRPKANRVTLSGESAIAQMLWGSILADFVSIYVAILNGVDPTPVGLIEKLKNELA